MYKTARTLAISPDPHLSRVLQLLNSHVLNGAPIPAATRQCATSSSCKWLSVYFTVQIRLSISLGIALLNCNYAPVKVVQQEVIHFVFGLSFVEFAFVRAWNSRQHLRHCQLKYHFIGQGADLNENRDMTQHRTYQCTLAFKEGAEEDYKIPAD